MVGVSVKNCTGGNRPNNGLNVYKFIFSHKYGDRQSRAGMVALESSVTSASSVFLLYHTLGVVSIKVNLWPRIAGGDPAITSELQAGRKKRTEYSWQVSKLSYFH